MKIPARTMLSNKYNLESVICWSQNPLMSHIRPDLPGIFNEANILTKYFDRYCALDTDLILPPYEVLIHLSGVCNLRCAWCIGGKVAQKSGTRGDAEVLPSALANPKNTEALLKNILAYEKEVEVSSGARKLKKIYRVENVSFSGIVGEPLIAKQSFIRAVDILTRKNIRIGLFSNATLLDDELIEKLLKISYINISLDAGTPTTYAALKYGGDKKGEAVFLSLVENIRKLVDARNKSGTSQLEINASFILYPDNYREILAAAELLKKIGIDNLRMKQDNWGEKLLSEKQMDEAMTLLDRVDRLTDNSFRFIRIHRLNKPEEMERRSVCCRISDLMAAIGSDGNAYPCNYHPRPGAKNYGNVIKNSFRDIWEGKKRRRIRKRLPAICPKVCDPFKNRANNLFTGIDALKERYGDVRIKEAINDLGPYLINN